MFPWPAPPPGELLPPRPTASDFAVTPEVFKWFVKHHAAKNEVPTGTPLRRWADRLAGCVPVPDGEAVTLVVDNVVSDLSVFGPLVDCVAGLYLGWAIRVLHGGAHPAVQVDGSFVTGELLAQDLDRRGVDQAAIMPSGVGTLWLAARLLQAGGGQIRVRGAKSPGRDIEWRPALGGNAWFERKDRAFYAGVRDTEHSFQRKLSDFILRAAAGMEVSSSVARIITVGAILPEDTARSFYLAFREVVGNLSWSEIATERHVDGVCLQLVGVGLHDGMLQAHDMSNFVENAASVGKPAWDAVRDIMRKAFGGG